MSTSGEHLVKYRPDAVDVRALIHILAGLSLLWRHVLESPDNMARQ